MNISQIKNGFLDILRQNTMILWTKSRVQSGLRGTVRSILDTRTHLEHSHRMTMIGWNSQIDGEDVCLDGSLLFDLLEHLEYLYVYSMVD